MSDHLCFLSDGFSSSYAGRHHQRHPYPSHSVTLSTLNVKISGNLLAGFTIPGVEVRQIPQTVKLYTTTLSSSCGLSLTFSPEAPAYLIDLMHDKNAEIRKVCDNTLDIIAVSEMAVGDAGSGNSKE